MKLLRVSAMLVGCFTLVAVTAAAIAEDKAANKDKIVGTWKITKSAGRPPSMNIAMQFDKDGKLKSTLTKQVRAKGKKKIVTQTRTAEGTYTVDGDKLTLVLKPGSIEIKATLTIKSLTDKKLVTVDEKGKEEEFEKKETK